MTTNKPAVTTVSDGSTATTRPSQSEHGVHILRAKETKALISLGCDALSEAASIGHEMHTAIYRTDASDPGTGWQQMLSGALTCLQTADHYLRMLGSVIDERAADSQGPWPAATALTR